MVESFVFFSRGASETSGALFCAEKKLSKMFWETNLSPHLAVMKQTHTPQQIEQLYKTIEQLQKELKAKHRQFIEQRAEADYYEMLYKTSQA